MSLRFCTCCTISYSKSGSYFAVYAKVGKGYFKVLACSFIHSLDVPEFLRIHMHTKHNLSTRLFLAIWKAIYIQSSTNENPICCTHTFITNSNAYRGKLRFLHKLQPAGPCSEYRTCLQRFYDFSISVQL